MGKHELGAESGAAQNAPSVEPALGCGVGAELLAAYDHCARTPAYSGVVDAAAYDDNAEEVNGRRLGAELVEREDGSSSSDDSALERALQKDDEHDARAALGPAMVSPPRGAPASAAQPSVALAPVAPTAIGSARPLSAAARSRTELSRPAAPDVLIETHTRLEIR